MELKFKITSIKLEKKIAGIKQYIIEGESTTCLIRLNLDSMRYGGLVTAIGPIQIEGTLPVTIPGEPEDEKE